MKLLVQGGISFVCNALQKDTDKPLRRYLYSEDLAKITLDGYSNHELVFDESFPEIHKGIKGLVDGV